ncbi:dihydrofolate reductase [Enemella dayhoffiae]|uniref:Dihydrofolate reductase n=1 Tax=Enemella dayhoffiae TaxID=2016507 RepID=A0A255H3N1_9ACTN|nr:2-hydroxyacid dehydrogenase [Enemella dayhoffiae]OYO22082.1 dihydrofolate reductase [Enemella dayhoffiae]
MPDPKQRLAWLPFQTREEAEAALGGLPDGVGFAPFVDPDDPWPDSIAEVGFLVVPYLTGNKGLSRAKEMTSLEVVQLNMAGYDGVPELIPDGVALCNAAGVHDTSTAELAIGLALAQGRQLDVYARNMPDGTWDRGPLGRSLADQRALILGYGSIGKAIERRLEPMEPASITRVASRARDNIHGIDELDELLPETDVVFVICPLNDATRGLLDARRLALLPDGALVVNVARGPIVDTEALVAETSSGRLRAALDVTDPEPLPADHPLWRSPGVLIAPHTGGPSTAFEPRANALIGRQLRHWAAGENLENRVL